MNPLFEKILKFRLLVYILLFVFLFIIAFMVLYRSQIVRYKSIKEDIEKNKQQLQQAKAGAGKVGKLEIRYNTLKNELAAMERKASPPQKAIPYGIVQAEDFVKLLRSFFAKVPGIQVGGIAFNTGYVSITTGEGVPSGGPPGGGPPGGGPPGGGPPPPSGSPIVPSQEIKEPAWCSMPTGVSVTAKNYRSIMNLLNQIGLFPVLLGINNISISSATTNGGPPGGGPPGGGPPGGGPPGGQIVATRTPEGLSVTIDITVYELLRAGEL